MTSGGVGDGRAGAAPSADDVRDHFAKTLYGVVPPPPDAVSFDAHATPSPALTRLSVTIRSGRRTMTVDAAYWPAPVKQSPAPVVVGLSFLGPAGVIAQDHFPIDPQMVVDTDPGLGLVDGRPAEHMRGAHKARWPLSLFRDVGVSLLLAGYGAFVPDCPRRWQSAGLWPHLGLVDGPARPGAISLWAYALSRLVDVAARLPGTDPTRIAVAGHSRLGKAALWAAANDPRIAAAIVNCAGCAGVALHAITRGERLTDLAARYPHWVVPALSGGAAAQDRLLDQDALAAVLAPRQLIVGSAAADAWADPFAEYSGLQSAAAAWGPSVLSKLPAPQDVFANDTQHAAIDAGPISYHLRPGAHGMTPYDWRHYLAALTGR